MVFAARKAVGKGVEIGMRPETPPRASDATAGNPGPAPAVDLLYITLHDSAQLGALETALDRVAASHGLTRSEIAPAPPTPGLVRFDYLSGSHRTHAIHIFVPAARRQPISSARAGTRPRLAIIIDDIGYDRLGAEAFFALPYPFTVSVLPNLPYSTELAEEAQRFGYKVMLHLPMESTNGDAKPEAIELRVGMSQEEVGRVLSRMLETVPYASGVNNHQGSRATTDPQLMSEVMLALRERDMFFVDSRTAPNSVAYSVARRSGVPSAYRTVFLDDIQTREATLQQLTLAEREAQKEGWAIAIGHPHPTTLHALAEFLPALESRGVHLVFVSELVR
jgi:polysaccharide deacetylase 2 family uncharacterized protein YibQ